MSKSVRPDLTPNETAALTSAPAEPSISVTTERIEFQEPSAHTVPVGFVPTPTIAYRAHRKALRATVAAALPPQPTPLPIPLPIPLPLAGARVLLWKQDPSVTEIGIRKAFLPNHVFAGPKDARIVVQGLAPVTPNAFGDLIETPGTQAFDSVHTFAVVRQVLTMYQRALGSPLLWQWNSATNTDPLNVFPQAGVTMNAFYSRGEKALKFFFFNKPPQPGDPPGPPPVIFTCRSLDIVAHETGHAVLDALKPNWLSAGQPPQTGGLHESFGDLTAIFLTLSQFDQVEAFVAQTKGNLHDKTFLSDLAEQFGLALGRTNGLRNADNDFKLSEVGNEVHAISQVFTGAIYDILADFYALQRNTLVRDDASTLYNTAEYLRGVLLKAIIAAPASAATYADIANQMLARVTADGKPVTFRNAIKNRFALREVVTAPLNADQPANVAMTAGITDAPGTPQNRSGCCGTMMLPEFHGIEKVIEEELKSLKAAAAAGGRR